MLATGHAKEERVLRIHLSLHIGLVRRDRLHTHRYSGHKDYNGTSTKGIQDTLKGQCKPRSNEIVNVTAYKQLVHLDLLEYIEKCKEVTVACNFGTAYDKCLSNAILLG